MSINYMRPVISPEVRQRMNEIGDLLADIFEGHGFTLFVFPLNDHNGFMNWISNAQRDDMIVALKEFIAINEGRAHDAPGEVQ